MKCNFCTIFAKNYLYQGLALYNSLFHCCPDFQLWVLCMDEITYEILKKLKLDRARLISLRELENEDRELLMIKKSRTIGEYCWTCKAPLITYILNKDSDIAIIVYLDSDLFFYNDPESIYNEFGNASIGITPHRFPVGKKYLEKDRGIYNAGFLMFRNDKNSLDCLKWYREKCLEWCFFRHENGKIGDQGYLNDWPRLFSGVHIFQHKGINLAPWNIKNYKIQVVNNQIFIDEVPLIFYHYHSFKIYSINEFKPCSLGFNIPKNDQEMVYKPYFTELNKIITEIKGIEPNFQSGFALKANLIEKIKEKLIGIINQFNLRR